MCEQIQTQSVLEGLLLLLSLCLLFNNHLKLSKLAAQAVVKRLILNSVMESSMYKPEFKFYNQLKKNLYLYDITLYPH